VADHPGVERADQEVQVRAAVVQGPGAAGRRLRRREH
jgi:hypothetical protein